MKSIFTLLFILIAILTYAQGAQGCDGTRYIEEIFDEVTVTSGVQYGASVDVFGNEKNLSMDIYEPAGDTQTKRPVIILAHGGSFIFGDRSLMAAACTDFAKKGYVAASIDYRLWSIGLGLPDSLDVQDIVIKASLDMKAAIRFFRKDADTDNNYRADENMILSGGLSAGAIVGLTAGMLDPTDDIPDFALDILEDNIVDNDFEGTSGNSGYSSEVQGIINWSGGLYKLDWLDSEDPPIASMHGNADGTVPYEHGIANGIASINGSGLLHPRALEVGVPSYLLTVEGGGHTDIYTDVVFADFQAQWEMEGIPFIEDVVCDELSNNSEVLKALQADVIIAPNPANEYTTIQTENIKEAYDLHVYDAIGQLVYRVNNVNDINFNLNQSKIGNGLFMVTLIFENTALPPVSKKVIFQ